MQRLSHGYDVITAKSMKALYDALRAEGFTDANAFDLVKSYFNGGFRS